MPANEPSERANGAREQRHLWKELDSPARPARKHSSAPGKGPKKVAEAKREKTAEEAAPESNPLTDGVQGMLKFPERPALPQLSSEEQALRTEALVKRHKLEGINFTLRPAQEALVKRILSSKKPLLVEADTGIGKTNVVFAISLEAKARGFRTVYVGDQRKLGDQAAKKKEAFILNGVVEAKVVDGRTAAKKRQAAYDKKADLTFITHDTFVKDFPAAEDGKETSVATFNWDNVGVVVFDETQLMQGKDGQIPLVEQIRKEHPDIRLIALSATLSRSSSDVDATRMKLNFLKKCFGKDARIIKFIPEESADEDIREKGTIQKPLSVPLVDKLFTLKLDRQQSKLALGIRDQGSRCIEEVRKAVEPARLFEERQDLPLWVPAFAAIERLGRKATEAKHRSLSTEAHLWRDLFGRISTLGAQPTLERYCYQYAKANFCEEWEQFYLPEIEGPVAKAKRGAMSLAHKRVVGNEKVAELVSELAKGTMYELILKSSSWDEVYSRAKPFFNTLREIEHRSALSERRAAKFERQNRKLDPEDKKTKAARWFFEAALRYTAQQHRSDHPKVSALLELVEQDFDMIKSSPAFIFSTNGRHSEFLAEVLHHYFFDRGKGLRVDALHGRMGEREKRETLEAFQNGAVNLIVSTIDYAGTGLDAPNPRWALIYALAKGEAHSIKQARGRVVNRALELFHLYALATSGTMEAKWHGLYEDRLREREAVIQEMAELVQAEFEV